MKLKDPIALCIGALGYAFILRLLNVSCPILKLTGISCPGCGMTRALISAVQFKFTDAFHFHPLWLLFLIFALILTILYIFEKKRVFNVFLFILVILFLIYFIFYVSICYFYPRILLHLLTYTAVVIYTCKSLNYSCEL